MTAIAAVLAFSATAALAQSADPAPDSAAAPVLVTPPPVVVAPTAAPAPAVAAPQPMQTVQTLPPPPAVDASAAEAPAPKPVAHTRTATRSTTVKSTSATNAPAPLAKAPVTPAAAPMPVAAPKSSVVVTPAPVPAAAVKQQQTTQTTQTTDETLPIAAGAGIVVLALAGGALALGRRKRRDEDVEVVTEPVVLADDMGATPDPVLVDRPAVVHAEPALARAAASEEIVREPVLASETLDGPVTDLPPGFDLSRYGPHVQAAYRGPTADNPSLSLRRRLSRARFFDQRERTSNMPAAPAEAHDVRTPEPAQAARTTDHITTRVRQTRPAFRPVFNS
jgi:hypothetical protein